MGLAIWKSKQVWLCGGLSTVMALWIAAIPGPANADNPNPGSAPVNIVSPLPLPVTGSVNLAGLGGDLRNAARSGGDVRPVNE